MKNKYILMGLISVSVPTVVFGALGGVTSLINEIIGILQLLDNLIFALALVYFFWGVAQFILKANDEKAREEGRKKIMWGIVALFVLASWWGLVSFLGGLVGVGPGGQNNVQNYGGFNSGGGASNSNSYSSGTSAPTPVFIDEDPCLPYYGTDELCPYR